MAPAGRVRPCRGRAWQDHRCARRTRTRDRDRGPPAPRGTRDRAGARGAREVAAVTDRLPRGSVVGRYFIHDAIGAGGMGVVYRAYDPELDRRVAIKLLRAAKFDGTDGQTWLVREAQALARLSHPNVVAIYDVGTHDDRVFIAMEYV